MAAIHQTRFGRLCVAAFALVGSCLLGGQSQAAIILPGAGPVSTPGTFTFAGLTTVADETEIVTGYDASSVARYTASVESKVLREPGGTLDFAYLITNILTPSQPDSLETVSVTSYRNFTTDVDYVNSGAVAYATVQRSPAIPLGGFGLTFDYTAPNVISPGSASDWILIKTNATYYDNNGTTSVIDGATATVFSYEPTVPEPMSASLLGVVATTLLARRSRRGK